MTILLNEAIEIENEGKPQEECMPLLREKFVRRHISTLNYAECFNKIVEAYTLSFLKKDEDDMEDDPNQESGSA